MDADKEILDAFLQESTENLEILESGLVELEVSPTNRELLSRLFRTVHTVKGGSGFLGFTHLQDLAHTGETLLGALRDSQLALTPEITTTLLSMVDALRQMLATVEANGTDGDDTYEQLQHAINELATGTREVRASPPAEQASTSPASEATAAPEVAPSSIRIAVDDLDSLMGLSAELIGVRTAIGDLLGGEEDTPLADAHTQLARATARLQADVMRARLQPMSMVVDRYKRIVRDLAIELGRQAHAEISGEEIAVDRAINDALKDPLTHLVRNAVDHGIEPAEIRIERGKPATGKITISCSQSHGRVILELADDGAGIDPQKLRDASVRKGLFDAQHAQQLPDQEAIELIFQAGISTATRVTPTSGRGVGMDAVRASLQRVGGSIEVSSELGRGSKFRIDVPLTIAIMSSLDVNCAGHRFAIPLVNVEEVLTLTSEEFDQLDDVDGAKIFRLRGNLIPLVDLGLLVKSRENNDPTGNVLVIVSSQSRRFALVVDAVGASGEIVVKPLPYGLKSLPIFTGVTIRGNGQPSLIVDVAGIAGEAEIHEHELVEQGPAPIADSASSPDAAMLLAGVPDGGKIAIRMVDIRRLDMLTASRVERVGDRQVVRYPEGILPLLRVHEILPERRKESRGQGTSDSQDVHIVVVDSQAGPVGLWVHSIDDIIPTEHVDRQPASRRGVRECVIVGERIAELLDIDILVADAGIEAQS